MKAVLARLAEHATARPDEAAALVAFAAWSCAALITRIQRKDG